MDAPANSVFSGPITSTFSAVCFVENPFTCRCKKEAKRLKGFKLALLLFLNDIIAVKGLIPSSFDRAT